MEVLLKLAGPLLPFLMSLGRVDAFNRKVSLLPVDPGLAELFLLGPGLPRTKLSDAVGAAELLEPSGDLLWREVVGRQVKPVKGVSGEVIGESVSIV